MLTVSLFNEAGENLYHSLLVMKSSFDCSLQLRLAIAAIRPKGKHHGHKLRYDVSLLNPGPLGPQGLIRHSGMSTCVFTTFKATPKCMPDQGLNFSLYCMAERMGVYEMMHNALCT